MVAEVSLKSDIKLLIETAKYIITGKLVLDEDFGQIDDNAVESVLLYALNCGKKFITLHDCVVSSKEHTEYQPEFIQYFHVNLDIVHTCRIIKDL